MLAVIVPTRGRPHVVEDLYKSVVDTVTVSTTRLYLVVDKDDPDLDGYSAEVRRVSGEDGLAGVGVVQGGTMVSALNEAALAVIQDRLVEAVGFLGDDHRPRTRGWDAAYLSALRGLGAGVVYGNDLLQYDFVPTQCAMSASIIRRLGWMAHPTLKHMYVDTLWRDMAKPVGKLRYLPDIIVEHMHYLNNKSPMDAGYERVNDPEVFRVDEAAFHTLHASGVVRQAAEIIRQLAVISS